MPLSASTTSLPNPNALAELALVGSVTGRTAWVLQPQRLGAAMRSFWSASRKLQTGWQRELTLVPEDLSESPASFERVALEIQLTELLTRIWATNWTIADRAQDQRDVERIMSNILHGMGRIRRDVLLLMVRNWQGTSVELVSRLDRFRRRSERWTDLLIAGPASLHGVWDFAVEPERARDFGSDSWSKDTSSANPASLLVSAGLRVMFGSPWPLGCCRHDLFGELLTSIRSTLPAEAFKSDGELRPAWEWQAG